MYELLYYIIFKHEILKIKNVYYKIIIYLHFLKLVNNV